MQEHAPTASVATHERRDPKETARELCENDRLVGRLLLVNPRSRRLIAVVDVTVADEIVEKGGELCVEPRWE